MWTIVHRGFSEEGLGYLPNIILEDDPRPVREQCNDRYKHGGGWQPFNGFHLELTDPPTLNYPNDPPLELLAKAKLREETLYLFNHGPWLVVVQSDGSFEACRVD